MKNDISIYDYEIGNQSNFDLLSFYEALPNKEEEEEDFEIEPEECHHSLFFPILKYCINILNNAKDLDKLKFNIGFYGNDNKIYVTVGRQMYDLFFTEGEGTFNDSNKITFDCGKDKFKLKSKSKGNKKEVIEEYKEFFDIPKETPNSSIKNKINEKAKELDMEVFQLIKNKKKTIISQFLKGYSHQESVLKAFEGKITGKFSHMPNLIFKKKMQKAKLLKK